jgi:ribosomal protein S18 acetylase RimI-like enzyme
MPFSIHAPSIEDKLEYTWRGITRGDIPEIWKLFQQVNRLEDGDHSETIDDLEREFDDPWSNPATDGRVIRTLKGKIAAVARVFVNPQPRNEIVAFLDCEMTPKAREHGLETECLAWLQERAVERLDAVAKAQAGDPLPRLIRTDFGANARESVRLYEENGFRQVRSFFKMERDLGQPIPDAPLPDGLTLRTYGEDIDEPMRQAFNEAFGDHWGSQPVPAEEWHPFVMDGSSVRRDLTLVVMDGDDVVAFSLNRVKVLENERLKIQRGWIGSLGTRRKYRKRGIGSALIVESMRRFKAKGFDSVGLGVDAENLTGALALYERSGFKAYKTRSMFEKRVG